MFQPAETKEYPKDGLKLVLPSWSNRDYISYLKNVENLYYEETMIEGLVIATSKMSLKEKFYYLKKFIPKIDNWAICDTVCSSFKLKEHELPMVWEFILS